MHWALTGIQSVILRDGSWGDVVMPVLVFSVVSVASWSAIVLRLFFFKQKTAYEITTGDWSSDVCSSDLGAHEQMHMLGRLLGVTTHNVFDIAELPELLYELRGCQFIMIDTAGASPRDPEVARRLRLLNQMQASIETSLVLPASTQAGAIDEVVQRFELAKPSSCVITKVDEAVSLGGVLSALVRHKLPVAYVSDGQRVPEDLAPARSHVLVSRAVEIASHSGATADDEVMQRRMSGVRNARK